METCQNEGKRSKRLRNSREERNSGLGKSMVETAESKEERSKTKNRK